MKYLLVLLLVVIGCNTGPESQRATLHATSASGEIDHVRIYKNSSSLLDTSYVDSPFSFALEAALGDSIGFTVITNNRFNRIDNFASPESLVAGRDTLADFKASYGHILSVRYHFK